MLWRTIIVLSVTCSPAARAISRRNFLKTSGAAMGHSILPVQIRLLNREIRSGPPMMAGSESYLTDLIDTYAFNVPPPPMIFTLGTTWKSAWEQYRRQPWQIENEVKEVLRDREIESSVQAQLLEKMKLEHELNFKKVMLDLAIEYEVPLERVQSAVHFLLEGDRWLVLGMGPQSPNFALLPLTDAFIESFLNKVAEFSREMSLATFYALTQIEGNTRSTLGLKNIAHRHWYDLAWLRPLDSKALLQVQFWRMRLRPRDLASLPTKASEAWSHIEPKYSETLQKVKTALRNLEALPESYLKSKILEFLTQLRVDLEGDVRHFTARYEATRALLEQTKLLGDPFLSPGEMPQFGEVRPPILSVDKGEAEIARPSTPLFAPPVEAAFEQEPDLTCGEILTFAPAEVVPVEALYEQPTRSNILAVENEEHE